MPRQSPAPQRTKATGRVTAAMKLARALRPPSFRPMPWSAGLMCRRARPRAGAADLPAYLERNKYATQSVAVGDRVWFGVAEGSVVCLDRRTGAKHWEYWTAGPILAAPAWSQGRVYAGSADGSLYCLDGATGKLCWRYRVAPDDRRISVMGRLSSLLAGASNSGTRWPGLCHGRRPGTTRRFGRVRSGRADGRGALIEVFKYSGATYSNGRLKDDVPTGGEGPMAWYGGKVWWLTLDWGPLVIDPATGAWKRCSLDESFLGDPASPKFVATDATKVGTWIMASGRDIGILPGGWVAIGNSMMFGLQFYHARSISIGSGGDSSGAGHLPQLLTLNRIGQRFLSVLSTPPARFRCGMLMRS